MFDWNQWRCYWERWFHWKKKKKQFTSWFGLFDRLDSVSICPEFFFELIRTIPTSELNSFPFFIMHSEYNVIAMTQMQRAIFTSPVFPPKIASDDDTWMYFFCCVCSFLIHQLIIEVAISNFVKSICLILFYFLHLSASSFRALEYRKYVSSEE